MTVTRGPRAPRRSASAGATGRRSSKPARRADRPSLCRAPRPRSGGAGSSIGRGRLLRLLSLDDLDLTNNANRGDGGRAPPRVLRPFFMLPAGAAMGLAVTSLVDFARGCCVTASCLRDLYSSSCFFMCVLCHTHAPTTTAATHTAVATGTTTLTLSSPPRGTQLNNTARSASVSPQHSASSHRHAHWKPKSCSAPGDGVGSADGSRSTSDPTSTSASKSTSSKSFVSSGTSPSSKSSSSSSTAAGVGVTDGVATAADDAAGVRVADVADVGVGAGVGAGPCVAPVPGRGVADVVRVPDKLRDGVRTGDGVRECDIDGVTLLDGVGVDDTGDGLAEMRSGLGVGVLDAGGLRPRMMLYMYLYHCVHTSTSTDVRVRHRQTQRRATSTHDARHTRGWCTHVGGNNLGVLKVGVPCAALHGERHAQVHEVDAPPFRVQAVDDPDDAGAVRGRATTRVVHGAARHEQAHRRAVHLSDGGEEVHHRGLPRRCCEGIAGSPIVLAEVHYHRRRQPRRVVPHSVLPGRQRLTPEVGHNVVFGADVVHVQSPSRPRDEVAIRGQLLAQLVRVAVVGAGRVEGDQGVRGGGDGVISGARETVGQNTLGLTLRTAGDAGKTRRSQGHAGRRTPP